MKAGVSDRRSRAVASSSLSPRPTAPQVDLRANRGDQPFVVPRLLDVVARPPAHRLDGAGHAAPGGHDNHRQRRIGPAQLLHQVEALLPRRRVARIVHVENRGVEVRRLNPLDDFRRRARRHDVEPFVAQEQRQRVQDVVLIVGNQNARGSSHDGLGRLAATLLPIQPGSKH